MSIVRVLVFVFEMVLNLILVLVITLTNTMVNKCVGKPVEVIEEKDLSENLFLKMDEGDFVSGALLGHKETRRSKRDDSCSSTRVL